MSNELGINFSDKGPNSRPQGQTQKRTYGAPNGPVNPGATPMSSPQGQTQKSAQAHGESMQWSWPVCPQIEAYSVDMNNTMGHDPAGNGKVFNGPVHQGRKEG